MTTTMARPNDQTRFVAQPTGVESALAKTHIITIPYKDARYSCRRRPPRGFLQTVATPTAAMCSAASGCYELLVVIWRKPVRDRNMEMEVSS